MKFNNTLTFASVVKSPELVCESIRKIVEDSSKHSMLDEILVAEIDPAFAGGADLCEHYNIAFENGANCVVCEVTTSKQKQFAACVYPVGARVDMNKTVRKKLSARRVSLADVDEVIEKTGMAYGSITPLGLPKDWPVLIDSRVILQRTIIIGSGKLCSKIYLPTALLVELTKALVVEGLAKFK